MMGDRRPTVNEGDDGGGGTVKGGDVDGMVATVAGVGFVLGLRHALDPDHVVAVTTLASQKIGLRRTSLVGAFWGLGHALSLGAVGGVILALRLTVPPAAGHALEAVVAVMLVVLGTLALRRALRWRLHAHPHQHDGTTHVHFHAHHRETPQEHGHPHPFQGGLRPFLVGLVHGLAGSAGLALLALTAAPTLAAGLAYLAIFGVGSIAGMLLLSTLLSVPLAYVEGRYATLHRAVQLAAGAVSVAFGLFVLWEHAAGAAAAAWLS
jgi:ABC-type nickel/cobalt efflux system permease component RcnA